MDKNLKIIIIAVIVLIAAVAFLLTRPQSVIVVPAFYFTVSPGLGAEYNLTVPQGYNATLNGEFVSTNNIEVAVLNDTQMTAFTNFRIATNFNKTYNNLSSAVSYTFNAYDNTTSKTVVVDVVNVSLSSGRYHLLFYNPNPEYLSTVQNFTYWANVSMVTPIVLNYTH